jgi:hypothetical protein
LASAGVAAGSLASARSFLILSLIPMCRSRADHLCEMMATIHTTATNAALLNVVAGNTCRANARERRGWAFDFSDPTYPIDEKTNP